MEIRKPKPKIHTDEQGLVSMATVQVLREVRGRMIFEKGDAIKRIDQNEYKVKSQSSGGDYQVLQTELGWLCSCPDAMFRSVECKHILAVQLSLKVRAEVENQILAPIVNTDSCIFCGSKHIVKDGLRRNKHGDIQKFNCLECKKYFTINLGFEKMKHNPQAITSAMQLYFSGESLRKTAESLRLMGAEVSHQTIHNWITKYVGLMNRYLDRITPNVGSVWRADELYLKVKGNMKYLFELMDDQTRFWIAQEVADYKGTSDIRPDGGRGEEAGGIHHRRSGELSPSVQQGIQDEPEGFPNPHLAHPLGRRPEQQQDGVVQRRAKRPREDHALSQAPRQPNPEGDADSPQLHQTALRLGRTDSRSEGGDRGQGREQVVDYHTERAPTKLRG